MEQTICHYNYKAIICLAQNSIFSLFVYFKTVILQCHWVAMKNMTELLVKHLLEHIKKLQDLHMHVMYLMSSLTISFMKNISITNIN